jgi:hypothetical protein
MSRFIAKAMNLEMPKRLIIWDGESTYIKGNNHCHDGTWLFAGQTFKLSPVSNAKDTLVNNYNSIMSSKSRNEFSAYQLISPFTNLLHFVLLIPLPFRRKGKYIQYS